MAEWFRISSASLPYVAVKQRSKSEPSEKVNFFNSDIVRQVAKQSCSQSESFQDILKHYGFWGGSTQKFTVK